MLHWSSQIREPAAARLMVVLMILLWNQTTAEAATSPPSSSSSPQPLRTSAFSSMPTVHDVMFTNDVLLEKQAASRIDCSARCADEAQCAMLTFRPTGRVSGPGAKGGSCRLHSKLQSSADAQQPAPGARSFNLEGTGSSSSIPSDCVTNSDCTLPLTACFSGQCLCDGGLFFELSQDACVSTCTLNLGETYLEYKNMDISMHNAFAAEGDTASCQSMCTEDPVCKGFTFLYGWCYFKHVTGQDVPGNWLERNGVVFYQRTCL